MSDLAPAIAIIFFMLIATLVIWAWKIRQPLDSRLSEEMIHEFRELADSVIVRMKLEEGVELRFDLESISWLDEYINSIRDSISDENREKLIAAFGSFLGETVIAVYGGLWVEHTPCDWGVKTLAGITAFPFRRVRTQIIDGPYDSIATFMRAIPAIAESPARLKPS